MKDKFQKYAEIKTAISKLEEELEKLLPDIIGVMQDQGAEEYEMELGKFIMNKRRTWSYPEEIKHQEESLKACKRDAERTGEATYEEKPILKFFRVS